MASNPITIRTRSRAPFALVKLHFTAPVYGTVNGRYAVVTPGELVDASLVGYAHSTNASVQARCRRLGASLYPILNGYVTVEDPNAPEPEVSLETLLEQEEEIERNRPRPQPGDRIQDFRGDWWVFEYVSRPYSPGKSAKVVVRVATKDGWGEREFYAQVFPELEYLNEV